MTIIDTHSHLYFSVFDDDREAVIDRCREQGVSIQIQIGCDELSSFAALELAKTHEDMRCVLGVHPCDADQCFHPDPEHKPRTYQDYTLQTSNFDELFALFAQWAEKYPDQVVGFGETGFDLYHRNTPELLALQEESFRRHLELCQQFNKPVILHTRNSADQTLQALDNFGELSFGGVWHCFCEDWELAQKILDRGLYIGVGGILTYPNAEKTREAVKQIPLNRLLTETDAPFLVPQSRRRETKRNESWFLSEVVETLAHIKNISVETVEKALVDNAKRLFNL